MTSNETSRPDRDAILLRRVVSGDSAAEAEVLASVPDTASVGLLVAAAVLTGSTHSLARATELAAGTRERQLVVLARAHVEGPAELFDGLVRDHLASYPDHVLAAWIATRSR
ncbi:MAG: hypothetical protein ACOH16_02095 [Propionibacteriaceae bacterium]